MKDQLVPELRFREFEGEWQKKKLGVLFPLITGFAFPGEYIVEEEVGPLLVRGAQITEGRLNNSKVNRYYSGSISAVKGKYYLQTSDVVFGMDGSKVGRNIARITPEQSGSLLVQRVARWRPNDTSSLDFAYQYLRSSHFINYIDRVKTSSGIPHVSSKDLHNYNIPLPTLPEQQKIATFLSLVDRRIAAAWRRVALLAEWKRGVVEKLVLNSDSKKQLVSEIFKVTRGKVLAVKEMKPDPDQEYCYPVYSSQTKNGGLVGYYKEWLYEDAITWTTDGANAGDTNFRKGKFYCTNVCGVLINKKGFSNHVVAEYLNSITKKYVSYVGNPKLMNNVMAEIPLRIPALEEQTRIASILTSIDARITASQKEVTGWENWKKGLLQKMLV